MGEEDISSLMSSDRIFEDNKKVLLLDDNIGTGTTMLELKKQLKEKNIIPIALGAVQYNWRNYYRVSTGDKKDIDRFEVADSHEESVTLLKKYKDGPTEIKNPISKKIIKNLLDSVISIDEPENLRKEQEGIDSINFL